MYTSNLYLSSEYNKEKEDNFFINFDHCEKRLHRFVHARTNYTSMQVNTLDKSTCVTNHCLLECDSVKYELENSIGFHVFLPYTEYDE
jgi:hypothetical protein